MRRTIGSVLSLLTLVSIAMPAQASSTSVRWSACGRWLPITSPKAGHATIPADVAVVSATDAWTVGSFLGGAGHNRPFVMRWSGLRWERVAIHVDAWSALLEGVAAVAPDDVWAVGRRLSRTGRTRTLVTHWDGRAWHRVAAPSPGRNAQLADVTTVPGRSTLWAVGTNDEGPLILRRGRNGWVRLRVPTPAYGVTTLNGVGSIGPRSAWAVGTRDLAGSRSKTFAMHWNGRRWGISWEVPSPSASLNTLQSVAWGTDGTGWAVGWAGPGNGPYRGLLLRWRRGTWTVRKWLPHPSVLSDVLVPSSSDAWVGGGGEARHVDPYGVPYTLRRHGSPWVRIPVPDVGAMGIVSMDGTPTNVWAVAIGQGDGAPAFTFHWC